MKGIMGTLGLVAAVAALAGCGGSSKPAQPSMQQADASLAWQVRSWLPIRLRKEYGGGPYVARGTCIALDSKLLRFRCEMRVTDADGSVGEVEYQVNVRCESSGGQCLWRAEPV